MKKNGVRREAAGVFWMVSVLLTILLLIVMSGCSLFGPGEDREVFFYSMGMVSEFGGEEVDYSMDYREDGHTIVMSRGIGGKKLSKDEAEDLIDYTDFSLEIVGSDDEIEIGPKKVRKLGFWIFGDWHVVQDFSINLDRGNYKLVGTTELNLEGGTRTDTVNLTIR